MFWRSVSYSLRISKQMSNIKQFWYAKFLSSYSKTCTKSMFSDSNSGKTKTHKIEQLILVLTSVYKFYLHFVFLSIDCQQWMKSSSKSYARVHHNGSSNWLSKSTLLPYCRLANRSLYSSKTTKLSCKNQPMTPAASHRQWVSAVKSSNPRNQWYSMTAEDSHSSCKTST